MEQRIQIDRLLRVVDMMATMHAVLKQRYNRRALLLDIIVLAAATVVVALTYADLGEISLLGPSQPLARVSLGIASVVVFFLSIVTLVVDWKGMSWRHKEAFDVLLGLKADLVEAQRDFDAMTDVEVTAILRRSASVLNRLIEIPDHQFNRLKAIHLRKKEVSRLLSEHPGSCARLVTFRVWLGSNRRVIDPR